MTGVQTCALPISTLPVTTSAGSDIGSTSNSNNNQNSVLVKDYVGKSGDQALNELQTAGLQPTTITQTSTSIPAGLVISQDPTGGTSAPAGSVVHLVVSAGAPIKIPNVYSLHLSQAQKILESAGFTVEVKGSKKANSVVVGVNPDSGNSATAGSVITITTK